MNWFDKILPSFIQGNTRSNAVPEGLWTKCPECEEVIYTAELKRNTYVCNKCDHHMRISARDRLLAFLDEGSATEIAEDIQPIDILKFKDLKSYKDRIKAAQKATGEKEAFIVMLGRLESLPVIAGSFDFKFMGGSMGSVVGEKFIRGMNAAIESRSPYIVFSASGGARMQEALISLMQMAKTSAALGRLRAAKLPFISVMTDPTMGGVSASLAMLGDINVAEPKALIGFAGQRVIEQTVRETLPEGFQRAEYLLEHGAIDRIINRKDMPSELASICKLLMRRPA